MVAALGEPSKQCLAEMVEVGPVALDVITAHLLGELSAGFGGRALLDGRSAVLVALASAFPGEFVRRFHHPEWTEYRDVLTALGATKDPAVVPSLLDALIHGPTEFDRVHAVAGVAEMGGPEAIEILWDAVAHPEYLVSCNAVRYLGWIGTAKDRDRLEALAQEVHSTILRLTPAQQEAVRAMAARAAEAIAVRESTDDIVCSWDGLPAAKPPS